MTLSQIGLLYSVTLLICLVSVHMTKVDAPSKVVHTPKTSSVMEISKKSFGVSYGGLKGNCRIVSYSTATTSNELNVQLKCKLN